MRLHLPPISHRKLGTNVPTLCNPICALLSVDILIVNMKNKQARFTIFVMSSFVNIKVSPQRKQPPQQHNHVIHAMITIVIMVGTAKWITEINLCVYAHRAIMDSIVKVSEWLIYPIDYNIINNYA